MAEKNPVDENGEATTQLHEAMADAVHDAITDPFKPTPRRGTAGEELDGPIAQPQGGAAGGDDDEDSPYDSGNDVAISSSTNSDVSDIYDTRKVQPIIPGNVFQQYASTSNARDAAERFQPKQFGIPENLHPTQFGDRLTSAAAGGTSDAIQDGDKLRIVGGNSAVLDSNADRVLDAQIREATHAGGAGVPALQAQQAAVRAEVLNVRAPMPITRALDPLARTPTPR